MDTCHICFEEKDSTDKKKYCDKCSPFICETCLNQWILYETRCPICKVSLVPEGQNVPEVRITIPRNIVVPLNETIVQQENDECRHILLRILIVYVTLTILGVSQALLLIFFSDDYTSDKLTFYVKEPMTYVLAPLLGMYVLMLIFILAIKIHYVILPCFRTLKGYIYHAEQVSQGGSGSIVN